MKNSGKTWRTDIFNEVFYSTCKGDVDEYIAVPTVSDSEISLEIELIKYAAYEALKACSEIK